MDRPVFFNFSTSQEITRCVFVCVVCACVVCKWCHTNSDFRSPYGIVPNAAGIDAVPAMADGANHILLFTVFNPMYPITVVSM